MHISHRINQSKFTDKMITNFYWYYVFVDQVIAFSDAGYLYIVLFTALRCKNLLWGGNLNPLKNLKNNAIPPSPLEKMLS